MTEMIAGVAAGFLDAGGMENSLILAVVLVCLGVVFIVAEVFFVSFGVLSVCSLVCLAGAVFIAFNRGPAHGFVFIVVEVALIPSSIVFALKKLPSTRWGRKIAPASPKPEDVNSTGVTVGLDTLLGKVGRAATMCRPAGAADIEGERYDVVAEGLTIAAGRQVMVIEVEGNRVVVREVDESASSNADNNK